MNHEASPHAKISSARESPSQFRRAASSPFLPPSVISSAALLKYDICIADDKSARHSPLSSSTRLRLFTTLGCANESGGRPRPSSSSNTRDRALSPRMIKPRGSRADEEGYRTRGSRSTGCAKRRLRSLRRPCIPRALAIFLSPELPPGILNSRRYREENRNYAAPPPPSSHVAFFPSLASNSKRRGESAGVLITTSEMNRQTERARCDTHAGFCPGKSVERKSSESIVTRRVMIDNDEGNTRVLFNNPRMQTVANPRALAACVGVVKSGFIVAGPLFMRPTYSPPREMHSGSIAPLISGHFELLPSWSLLRLRAVRRRIRNKKRKQASIEIFYSIVIT